MTLELIMLQVYHIFLSCLYTCLSELYLLGLFLFFLLFVYQDLGNDLFKIKT